MVCSAVGSFLLLFRVSSEIASVWTCSCRTCRNAKESGAPDLKECSALMEQLAVYGACAVYRLCEVWLGPLAPNKAWERVGVGGGGGGWMYRDEIVTKEIHLWWIRFQEAQQYQQRLSHQKKQKKSHDFWTYGFSVESACYSTTERSDCFHLEARILGDSQRQRVSSLEWGRLITYVQKPESHLLLWG